MAIQQIPARPRGLVRRALEGLGFVTPACTVEITVGFGVQHKFAAESVVDPLVAEAIVRELAGVYYNLGATYVRTRGRYRDGHYGRRPVEEPGLQVTAQVTLGPGENHDALRVQAFNRALCCAAAIRRALGQRSIMVVFRDEHGRGLVEFVNRAPTEAPGCELKPAEARAVARITEAAARRTARGRSSDKST